MWVLQYVNVTSFLVANIYVVSGRCRWFSPFTVSMGTLQWTCWNALFLSFMVRLPANAARVFCALTSDIDPLPSHGCFAKESRMSTWFCRLWACYEKCWPAYQFSTDRCQTFGPAVPGA